MYYSKYNSETREKGRVYQYVELIPSNSKRPTSGLFENHSANGFKLLRFIQIILLFSWESRISNKQFILKVLQINNLLLFLYHIKKLTTKLIVYYFDTRPTGAIVGHFVK